MFLYLFVAMLPLREDDSFHAAPFVLFCLFLVGVLTSGNTLLCRDMIWLAPTLVLASSGARYVAQHALQSDFDRLISEAQLIREAVQNRSDVQLGHYPDGNYMYYLTGLRPISKFVDFYPWVAEIGRTEVDSQLARAPDVVLVMELSGRVWTYPNYGTLETELAYAQKHLIKEKFGWLTVYVSPWLTIQGGAGTEAAFTALAGPLEDVPVEISGGWRKEEGEVYRSTGSGVIRFGPIRLAGHSAMAIPVSAGPDNHNLSVKVRDAVSKKVLARLEPPPARGDWWAWRPELPRDPELTFEVVAEGRGLALGWPHWLRQANPAKAFRPGVYRKGEWRLDAGGSSVVRLGGAPDDIPVTGDWDGSGKTKPGIYRASTGEWSLDGIGKSYRFGGKSGDLPVTGDWDGSGRTKPGIYKPATGVWLLQGTHMTYHLGGQSGDIPVTGDWDGSGKTRPGIYKPSTGEWIIYSVSKTWHFGGVPGDIPVVGDWNGDGRSKPGIFRRGSTWLLDMDGNYRFEDLGDDVVITFGSPGDKPVAGVW